MKIYKIGKNSVLISNESLLQSIIKDLCSILFLILGSWLNQEFINNNIIVNLFLVMSLILFFIKYGNEEVSSDYVFDLIFKSRLDSVKTKVEK